MLVVLYAGSKAFDYFFPATGKTGGAQTITSVIVEKKDIPLIIPEVNPEALVGYKERNIIANPNCSTIQMLVALKPLHDLATIKRIVVATYQAVSGAGKEAMDELYDSTKKIYANTEMENKNEDGMENDK